MRRIFWTICLIAASLLLASALPRALADPFMPTPEEDVTKLEKPTISYNSYDSYEIRLMDWDGTNDRLWLSNGKIRFTPMEWSPNGKRAAVITFDKRGYTPYVIDLKTGKSKNLIDLGIPEAKTGYRSLSWSPDGNWVTMIDSWYVNNIIIHGFICKVNVVNGKYVRLTKDPWMHPDKPTWSPDGKRIAFSGLKEPKVAGVPANSEIFVMNADGSNLTNLTDHPAWEEYPTWSPDGKKIVFRGYRDNQEIEVSRPVGRGELYMIDLESRDVERLTFNTGWEGSVSWSPDSQWFVYRAGPVGPGPDDKKPEGVYRMHLPTREVVLVLEMEMRSPNWVLAGKSRFLSVDPEDKKKAQWGALKKAGGSPNNPTSQDGE